MAAGGKVYLVGAGPGDPGLLTLRGRECLQQAGCVVYDALLNPALLQFAPHAEQIFVGKKRDRHSLPQEDICRILIQRAQAGLHVVRLKGGDPFIFGRGGEEALALRAAGIAFEIVPGITAGLAGAAYAGIPPTHRGYAGSVALLTAHGAGAPDFDPAALIEQGTLIFYMGLKHLAALTHKLIEGGKPADTPAAVVEAASFARQRTVQAPLDALARETEAAGVTGPAVVIVGAVAALRERLAWFEERPLYGLRVVVTHARERRGELEQRLRDLGADVFALPLIEYAATPQAEAPAFEAGSYDWIVLTSVNAADMLFHALERQQLDARALAPARLCAVGAAAAAALEKRYLRVDVQPERYESAAVVAAMAPLAGKRVLAPRADIARSTLPQALREAGAQVDEWVAYASKQPTAAPERLEQLEAFDPQLFVFTNAAAVRNFHELVASGAMPRALAQAPAASIGPVTTRALAEAGRPPAIEPQVFDVAHLVEAICVWRDNH